MKLKYFFYPMFPAFIFFHSCTPQTMEIVNDSREQIALIEVSSEHNQNSFELSDYDPEKHLEYYSAENDSIVLIERGESYFVSIRESFSFPVIDKLLFVGPYMSQAVVFDVDGGEVYRVSKGGVYTKSLQINYNLSEDLVKSSELNDLGFLLVVMDSSALDVDQAKIFDTNENHLKSVSITNEKTYIALNPGEYKIQYLYQNLAVKDHFYPFQIDNGYDTIKLVPVF